LARLADSVASTDSPRRATDLHRGVDQAGGQACLMGPRRPDMAIVIIDGKAEARADAQQQHHRKQVGRRSSACTGAAANSRRPGGHEHQARQQPSPVGRCSC